MAEGISSHQPKKSYWETELEKTSLAEPPMKPKITWLKPLSIMHRFEFRGLDKRDYYEPEQHDAWEHQVWNIPSVRRTFCSDYFVDYVKCVDQIQSLFPLRNSAISRKAKYCWKMHDNYVNCKRET